MGTDVIGGLLIVPVVAETVMGFLMSTLGSGPNGLSNSFPWSPFQSGSIILATTSIPVHILALKMAKKNKNNSYFLLDLVPITVFLIVNSFTKQKDSSNNTVTIDEVESLIKSQ